MPRPFALALAAAALLTATAAPALADGVRTGTPISRAEVLAESPVILVVKVDKIAHKAGFRNAQRYIERHRVGGKVTRVLRGDAEVQELLGKAVWLERDNPIVPGKWVKIERPYPPTRQLLGLLTRGETLVAYVRDPSHIERKGRQRVVSVHELDRGAAADTVAADLVKVREAQRVAKRKGARCKVDTWFFKDACRTREAIGEEMACPDGTKVVALLHESLDYRLRCERPDGTPHGEALQWDPTGEARWRRGLKDGKPHGKAIDYGPKSQPKLVGGYANGRHDGDWVAYDPETGKELGRATMKAGTGTLASWYPDGTKRSERAYKDGVEHGPSQVWSESGVLLVEGGAKQGMVHGRFVYYNDDGTPRLVACYKKGKTRWEIDDPEKIPKALKKRCR